jgi:hypothetical protein
MLAYSGFILIRGFGGVVFSDILFHTDVPLFLLKNDFCSRLCKMLFKVEDIILYNIVLIKIDNKTS